MKIVRNKFEVWSFSLGPELKQCCTSTSCESWPRTPPHEEPFLFQSLVAFIFKRRNSNTYFEMVNEPFSLAAWRSFERRDRTEKDRLMKLVSNEKQRWRCFGLRTWKICGQSMTKRSCCSSKRSFHIYMLLVNLYVIANRIAQRKRGRLWSQYDWDRSLPRPVSFSMLDYLPKTCVSRIT